jgi:hypothetical protein
MTFFMGSGTVMDTETRFAEKTLPAGTKGGGDTAEVRAAVAGGKRLEQGQLDQVAETAEKAHVESH